MNLAYSLLAQGVYLKIFKNVSTFEVSIKNRLNKNQSIFCLFRKITIT